MLGNLGNNGYAKAPQCYVCTDIAGIFLLLSVYYYYYYWTCVEKHTVKL